jgi:hypothetical protein
MNQILKTIIMIKKAQSINFQSNTKIELIGTNNAF